jgi:hypothetical protein
MQGRAFLEVAQRLCLEQTEADWRTAAGRAYYALRHQGREALERWGFLPGPREQIHTFVRLRFTSARPPDLHRIGTILDSTLAKTEEGEA